MKRELIVAIGLLVVGVGGYLLFQGVERLEEYADEAYEEMQQEQRGETNVSPHGMSPWVRGGDWYIPIKEPPACPEPMVLQTPVDLAQATAVLYPGQYRGAGMEAGNYKPHGGLRFDGLAVDAVQVSLPYDATLMEMARYLAEGEVQYTLEFITDCGVVMRLGHLRELVPPLARLAEDIPPPAEGDSRTYAVDPLVMQQGDSVALASGLRGLGASPGRDNTFLDWGVYDLRQKNQAAVNPEWSSLHPSPQEQHAVCWFTWLSKEDEERVRLLPAGSEGAVSDFCEPQVE